MSSAGHIADYLDLLASMGYDAGQTVDEALEIQEEELTDLDERAFIAGYVVGAFMFSPRDLDADGDEDDDLEPVPNSPLTVVAA
jgi:hypothetical protein